MTDDFITVIMCNQCNTVYETWKDLEIHLREDHQIHRPKKP